MPVFNDKISAIAPTTKQITIIFIAAFFPKNKIDELIVEITIMADIISIGMLIKRER